MVFNNESFRYDFIGTVKFDMYYTKAILSAAFSGSVVDLCKMFLGLGDFMVATAS